MDDLPVDETIAIRLNKTGKLKLEEGPEFEIEDGEMSIDFDSVTRQTKFPPLEPIYSRKPNEEFYKDTKFSRKSMRFAGQFAVLGFGAIVVILGLYIVQYEPTPDSVKDDEVIVKKLDLEEPQKATTTEDSSGSGLQLTDGTVAALSVEEKQPKSAPAVVENKQPEPEPVAIPEAKKPEVITTPSKPPRQVATYAELDSTDSIANSSTAVAASSAPKTSQNQNVVASQSNTTNTFDGKDIDAGDSTASYADLSESAPTGSTIEEQPLQSDGDTGGVTGGESVAGAVAMVTVPVPVVPQTAAPSALTSGANEAQLGNSSTSTLDDEQQSYDTVPGSGQPLTSASASTVAQISEETLDALMSSFIKAYESANLNSILSLFAPNARTNKRTTLAGIKSDYEALFGSTSLRQMSFNSLSWEREGDHARGVGEYIARINPNGTQDSQSFAGNVTIQINQLGDAVKITRFYFSNQKVSSGPRLPEAGQTVAVAKPAAVVSIAPSIAELNDVIDNFIKAYDQGDIDGLMSIFAPNARTNDQSTLAGIRKDHVDLFRNTSVRQMTLDNMKWTFDKDIANGIANFVVLVQGINEAERIFF